MSKGLKIGIRNDATASVDSGTCEIYFLDTIRNPEYYNWDSGETEEGSLLENVISQVKYSNPSKIMCYIDSLGGSAPVGFAIYNFLKDYPAKVECKILGMCGSIATVIACAAKKVTMPRNGFYIIHEASNVAAGRAQDLIAGAEVAKKYTSQLCDVWSQKTGITADELAAMIAPGDYWMTGQEAAEKGFVDACYNSEDVKVTALIAAAVTANVAVPDNILAMKEAEKEPTENNESILTKIQDTMKSFSEMVTAAVDKMKGLNVTAKAGENITANISEAVAPVLAEMAASIQTEVTAEIATVTEKVTADVTAKMEEAYGGKLTEQASTIAALKESLDAITADLTKMAGKGTAAAGVTANADPNARPALTGKFANEA